MPASAEGIDFNSWTANRAAFRKQTKDAVATLEDLKVKLALATGPRRPGPSVTFADQSVSGITSLAEQSIAALKQAEAEGPQIVSRIQEAQIEYAGTRSRLSYAAQQRAKQEAEQAAQRQFAARKGQSWIKGKVLKIVAIGVLLVTFFILYKF